MDSSTPSPAEIEDFFLFLDTCARMSLYNALDQDWFNTFIPGACDLAGCDQGSHGHLEGDAALHTCMVFENLIETARRRLGREPDRIEKLSVLLHDLSKPATRSVAVDGSVSFPGHEARAAELVPDVSRRLGLSDEEQQQLLFVVAHHGDAYYWPVLSEAKRAELQRSPWVESLALLHEADAKSCLLAGGEHSPVYWEEILSQG